MNEIELFLEGIENKIKRLLINQDALKNQIAGLKTGMVEKNQLIEEQRERIEELEKKIEVLSAAKAISGEDNTIAKHRVNELLRDIDRCLILLNR